MRQLKICPRPPETLARHHTEETAARLALAALPDPANLPPDLRAETFGPAATRFLFSVARQYEDRGLTFVELVLAGRKAVLKSVAGWEKNPDKARAGWSWCVRQGMLRAIQEKI